MILGLPGFQTEADIFNKLGITFAVGAFSNSQLGVLLCFKGTIPLARKTCSATEYERAKVLELILRADPCQWVVSYELYNRNNKFFTFMPFLPNVEFNPDAYVLDGSLWRIGLFARQGFAHNDIKPSNILLNSVGYFILADLGSLVPLGSLSSTTPAYSPLELQGNPFASDSTDYWMLLAMTIFYIACGGNISRS
eukprot:gene39921-48612_t